MFKSKFQIGMAAAVLLVMLRMGLGCHFLYEGLWKIRHPEFSAEPFLTQAKGPLAPMFHDMVYDVDGRDRLKVEMLVNAEPLVLAMRKARDDSETRYRAYVKKPFDEERKPLADTVKSEDATATEKDAANRRIAEIEREIVQELRKTVNPFRDVSWLILGKAEDDLQAAVEQNEKDVLACFVPNEKKLTAEEKKARDDKLRACLIDLGKVESDYFKALAELAKDDENSKQAVARSSIALVPKVDEKTDLAKLVAGNVILNAEQGPKQVLRVENGIKGDVYLAAWRELKQATVDEFSLDNRQQFEAERALRRYKDSAREYLAENLADIAAYFGSLDRLEAARSDGNNGAAHQKQRLWDEQQKLRREVGLWLDELDAMEHGYQEALCGILNQEQKDSGPLPTARTRSDLIDFSVTWGLTAIGVCLLLGLFCRPAALGGGVFLLFVILTQPAWPTIYPPAPPASGHALLINKDFIEMLALFLLATTAVGRWGGLDYFVENYIIKLCCSRK